VILRLVEEFRYPVRPRIWLDVGTCEGDSPAHYLEQTRGLRQTLLSKGWQEGQTLAYHEIEDGTHSEAAWAARFGAVLAFLFPKRAG
jgi:ribonuclease I